MPSLFDHNALPRPWEHHPERVDPDSGTCFTFVPHGAFLAVRFEGEESIKAVSFMFLSKSKPI